MSWSVDDCLIEVTVEGGLPEVEDCLLKAVAVVGTFQRLPKREREMEGRLALEEAPLQAPGAVRFLAFLELVEDLLVAEAHHVLVVDLPEVEDLKKAVLWWGEDFLA